MLKNNLKGLYMRIKPLLAGVMTMAALTGCVAEGYGPAPYYGGSAPYYGTAYAPAYVGVYGGGDYYHHYGYHNIHSGYNNGYWHYQRAAAGGVGHGAPAGVGHGAPAGGGGHGGGGHGGGGGGNH